MCKAIEKYIIDMNTLNPKYKAIIVLENKKIVLSLQLQSQVCKILLLLEI